jgi:hypothetical protein
MGFQSSNDSDNPGLGFDLLNMPGGLQSAIGLGAALMQGTGMIPAPAMVPDSPEQPAAAQAIPQSPRVTDQNVDQLGRVLTAECGGMCNADERRGVGSTVINRMNRDGTDSVADVTGDGDYAVSKTPSPAMLETARQLLTGQLTDNTGGATNFYSPVSMPREGQTTGNNDIGGGLEETPGLESRNWSPGFANGPKKYPQNTVLNARDWVVKFYTQPGNGKVY